MHFNDILLRIFKRRLSAPHHHFISVFRFKSHRNIAKMRSTILRAVQKLLDYNVIFKLLSVSVFFHHLKSRWVYVNFHHQKISGLLYRQEYALAVSNSLENKVPLSQSISLCFLFNFMYFRWRYLFLYLYLIARRLSTKNVACPLAQFLFAHSRELEMC